MAGYLIGTIEVKNPEAYKEYLACLLYTSDAADE